MFTLEISVFGIATLKENGKIIGRWEAQEGIDEWFEQLKKEYEAA